MPIAKIQLPDGRIAKFEVAEGTTPEQVMQFANSQFSKSQLVDAQPEPQQQPQQEISQQPIKPAQPFGMGAEFVKKAAEYIPQKGKVGAFLNTATNLGGMPRVKALTASLTAKALGADESIGAFYDEALGNELRKLKQAREQYPKTSIAGQLLADVATARLLGIKGATAKQALAGGAVLGGLSAAGETEADLASSQGLSDVGAGGLYGAGGGVVGQQVGKAIGKSVPFVKKAIQRFKGSTPESILSTVLTPQEAATQAGKLAGRIEQGRITALPELGNENILGLTRILGKTQGSNKIINEYINKKTATSAKRVGDLINNNLSAESYFNKLDDTIAKRKDIAGPLYEQAQVEGEQFLKKILKTEKINKTVPVNDINGNPLKDPATGIPITKTIKVDSPAKKLYDNPNIVKYINRAKNEPLFVDPRLSNNSFVVLKGAKEMIDEDISQAMRAGKNKTASALIGIKKQVLNILETASPSYKEANKIFAGESALINAQEEGLKFNQYRNGEEVKRAFSKLSDGEKETFKIGVKDYLMDKVSKSSERNPTKAIFGNQLEYGKLKAVFNNPKEFKDFAQRLSDEIRVFDVKQRIVGGSRTDFNLAESDQFLDKIAKGAANIKKIGVADLILASANAIKRKYYGLNEQTAKELAKVLINPKKSVQVLNNIVKKAQTAQEKDLIQKFTENLSKKNFARAIAPSMGRAMATEQLNNEGE